MSLRLSSAVAVPAAIMLVLGGFAATAASPATPTSAAVAADTGHPATARESAIAPDQQIPLAISLRPRDEAGLIRFDAAVSDPRSPLFRHFLTAAQYNALFAPSASQVASVEKVLRAKGLRVTGVSGNGQVVDATGPAGVVGPAFGVTLHRFSQPGKASYYAADGTASLPTSIAGLVSYVAGLTDRPVAVPAAAPGGDGPSGGESPADLQTAYTMGSTVGANGGSGETVGLAEFDGFNQSDITTFTQNYNLPALTPTVAAVDGGVSSLGSGQIEVTLDIDAVDVYAPKAAQLVYEAPNTDTAWVDEWSKIASDDKVKVISNSWLLGESCESQPISPTHDDTNQMVSEGITILSASGDWGGHGCDYNGDNSTVTVDYPASDPNVTGVGGTTLSQGSGGSYQSETVWNSGSSGNTRSGGGYSSIYATPSWQSSVNSTKFRSVPDVSDAADPNAGGLSINLNGGWESVGGTSEAAPLWAGYVADLDQRAGKSLGNINPTVYQIGGSANYGNDFHDVTQGNNDTYNAGTGYDLATGWGSPIGDKLAGDLLGGSPPPSNDFSISASPTSGSVQAGQSTTTTVTTAVTSGSAENITLSASGLPSGATATFAPTSLDGAGHSTLTIATTSSTPSGTYQVRITGSDTDTSHSTTFALTVTGGPNGSNDVVNGDFETGTLAGWTSTGATSVVGSPVHGGSHAGQAGTGNGTLSQTFTAHQTGLSLWYVQVCAQGAFGVSTITLADNTANSTQNLLNQFCGQGPTGYTQLTASLTSGDSYTITIDNQDFGFGGGAATVVDDVTDATS
jgi:subtilase family serine protease